MFRSNAKSSNFIETYKLYFYIKNYNLQKITIYKTI